MFWAYRQVRYSGKRKHPIKIESKWGALALAGPLE